MEIKTDVKVNYNGSDQYNCIDFIKFIMAVLVVILYTQLLKDGLSCVIMY